MSTSIKRRSRGQANVRCGVCGIASVVEYEVTELARDVKKQLNVSIGLAVSRIPNSDIALATIDRVTDVRAASKNEDGLHDLYSGVSGLYGCPYSSMVSVGVSGTEWTGPVNVNVKK